MKRRKSLSVWTASLAVKQTSALNSKDKREELAVLKPALIHLAMFLIDQGITAGELQSTISEVFVKAASSRARMKNGRVNQSRVAAMTGCTRTEVRRLVNFDWLDKGDLEIYGARRLLEGWRRDPEFLTRSGRPKKLRVRGGYGAFPSLAKKYSADIPPKASLDELKRLNAVVVSKGFAAQRTATEVEVRRRSQNLSRAALQLMNIFQAMGYPDAVAPVLTFSGSVTLETFDNTADRVVKQRVEQNTKAFLAGLESASTVFSHQKSGSGKRKTNRTLVRVSVANLSRIK